MDLGTIIGLVSGKFGVIIAGLMKNLCLGTLCNSAVGLFGGGLAAS